MPLRAGFRHRAARQPDQPRAFDSGKYFREYVVNYTNAATIVTEEFTDTEELDGLFSGFDAGKRFLRPAQLDV